MRPPPRRDTSRAFALSTILSMVVLSNSPGGKAGDGIEPKRATSLPSGPNAPAVRDPFSASFGLAAMAGPKMSGQIQLIIQVDLWRGKQIDLVPWETKVWAKVEVYDPNDIPCAGIPLFMEYSRPTQMVAGELCRKEIPYWTELAPSESPYPVIVRLVNRKPDGSESTAAMQRFTCHVQR